MFAFESNKHLIQLMLGRSVMSLLATPIFELSGKKKIRLSAILCKHLWCAVNFCPYCGSAGLLRSFRIQTTSKSAQLLAMDTAVISTGIG